MKEEKALTKIELAWREFMSSGKLNTTSLRSEIRASWERCRKLGIDPYDGSSPTVLSESDLATLLSKKKDLIGIAIPFMKRLYDVINDSGFAVVLTDEKGYILEIVRTPDLEEAIIKTNVNYLPGSRWLKKMSAPMALIWY